MPKKPVLLPGNFDNQNRLVYRQAALFNQDIFHHCRLFRTDVTVRIGNPAQEVGKSRQKTGLIRVHILQLPGYFPYAISPGRSGLFFSFP